MPNTSHTSSREGVEKATVQSGQKGTLTDQQQRSTCNSETGYSSKTTLTDK